MCVHTYVCAGVCLGYVEWVGLCQASTGASVGEWAECLWCGQGGGWVRTPWVVRRQVSSENVRSFGAQLWRAERGICDQMHLGILGWVRVSGRRAMGSGKAGQAFKGVCVGPESKCPFVRWGLSWMSSEVLPGGHPTSSLSPLPESF